MEDGYIRDGILPDGPIRIRPSRRRPTNPVEMQRRQARKRRTLAVAVRRAEKQASQ